MAEQDLYAASAPAQVEDTAESTPAEGTVSAEGTEEGAPEEGAEGTTPEEGAEDSPAVKRKNAVQERIDELTREKYTERERADKLAMELAAIKAKEREVADPAQAPKPPDPNLQFEDPERYQAEQSKWIAHVSSQAVLAEQRRMKEMESIREKERFVLDSVAKFRAKVNDYDVVLKGMQIPEATAQIIADTENPAALAYFLGKNPQEAAKVYSMTPVRQAMYIGQLETKIKSSPPVKKTTSAPNPVKTLKGNGRVDKPLADAPVDDFIRQRNQQLAQKNKRR